MPTPTEAQVASWARQIRKEMGQGLALDMAALEARQSFENLGMVFDAQHEANWTAARQRIRDEQNRPIEILNTASLRKPRRPDWYSPPGAAGIHWTALDAFLRTRKDKWSTEAIDSIDVTSNEVVSLFENPNQSSFSGRGLVVGYVQSGKTANMTAVIAKAVDAGYRFVIVLAGMTNALRRQTQRRLNGDLIERNRHSWIWHTTEDDTGDFRIPPNQWFAVTEQTQVAVVKKNVTPLRQLIATIKQTIPAHRDNLPFLIIDDECDQASVNAGGQFNITRINRQIRELLQLLPRVQYVGYTATPFANVLINPVTPEGVPDDLYPQDFITALPRPEGYFGPESLFGRDPIDADNESADEEGLDMIRPVADSETASLQPASMSTRFQFQAAMTESLEKALRWFVISTACRYFRGDRDEHSSMLVHTTTYTYPHERLADLIREWRDSFRKCLKSTPSVHSELEALWLEETPKVNPARWGLTTPAYADISPFVADVLYDIEIVVENSDSESRLDYVSGPKKYIVVGGSVLARGLTIEGLTVSLFIRSSSQYDTLLQMGRWFGYRPGYQDLPRIWMTADLADSFHDLATVEAEIRADMSVYRDRDLTPRDFAIRIRQIPGMSITAASKMIAAETCDVSFSDEHTQTIRFQRADQKMLEANWDAAAKLVDAGLAGGGPEQRSGGRLIRGVAVADVIAFLKAYTASKKDQFREIVDYIEAEREKSDRPFAQWNVGVIEPGGAAFAPRPLGSLGPVRMVNRSRLTKPRADGATDIKALMSKADVLLDVDTPAKADSWESVKAARNKDVGNLTPLLLLYPIDRNSQNRTGSEYRAALEAVDEIMGVGIVFPDRGTARSYVRVKLEHEDAAEDVSADLPQDETV